ncbi:cupin domain-containing protein [Cypionkella sp. TWP1-2-1b2]|uniref:cupin domain-containing protein n=1 Tax=Cypionkella sp. TWP1-2-1b2 TaxID=2804675 RepID=UPI003CF64224
MTTLDKSGLRRRGFVAGAALVTAVASVRPVLAEMATVHPHHIAPSADLDWFPTVPGEQMAIHVPSAQIGGRFAVVETIAEPGAAAPPHIHRSADEYFFVQQGEMHFVCDGVEFDAAAGTSVLIPRGVAHTWVNLTDKPVRTLVTFTPGGIEQMFKELAAVFPHGVEDLAARYDTYLTT